MGRATAVEALDRLRDAAAAGQLDDMLVTHGVGLLVAFGSAARGEQGPRDLDLAYSSLTERAVDVLGLLGALEDHTGSDLLDLLDLDRANVVAAARALTRCVPLYEATAGLFAAAQLRAAMVFADTRWMRAAQLRALSAG